VTELSGFKLKGTGVRSTLEAAERVLGAAPFRAALDRLPADLRAIIDAGILAAGWYPVELNATFHAVVHELHGRGSWELNREIGRNAARSDFSGVYRVLLRTVSHATLWERVALAWRQYNSGGEAAFSHPSPGHAVGDISGVAGYNRGLWESVAGRMEVMLQMTGVRAGAVTMREWSSTGMRAEVLWIE
jgi:hypothetical protein